jgi:uncharacterized protein with PQ loop repeat
MEIVTVVGYLAAICSVVSFTPQAWKIIKTRDTKSISAPMYAITVVGFAFWLGISKRRMTNHCTQRRLPGRFIVHPADDAAASP